MTRQKIAKTIFNSKWIQVETFCLMVAQSIYVVINVKDLYKSPNLCLERYSSKHQHLTFSTFTYEDHLSRKQADMFPSELSVPCLSHMMAKPRSTAQACIFSLNRQRGWKESRGLMKEHSPRCCFRLRQFREDQSPNLSQQIFDLKMGSFRMFPRGSGSTGSAD